tara:strand:- start:21446 stop:22219 length:774 start_codon:yes stop_codon:yes gene_type:complete
MDYSNIKIELKNKICFLTINRPKNLNSLNIELIDELSLALKNINDDKSIRCLIITGAGDKAFVAGADIKEFMSFNQKEGEQLSRSGQEKVFDLLENLSKPAIAAINGFALGGGLELAMACHIRISSTTAKLGLPEVSLGVIPGYGGTQRLAKLVGAGKAYEIILTADMITADEAREIGLINHVCSPEDLMNKATILANRIIRNSPFAIEKTIKAVNKGLYNNLEGYEEEKKLFGSCFKSNDFNEGVRAFIEKRKPNF